MDGHYCNVPRLAEYDSRALMPAHSRPVLIKINTDMSWETKLFSIERAGQQRSQEKNAIQPPKPRAKVTSPPFRRCDQVRNGAG